MIKNGQLNELENALLAAQETKSLSPELIRRFASRTVTEHLHKNNYDAAMVRKSSPIRFGRGLLSYLAVTTVVSIQNFRHFAQ